MTKKFEIRNSTAEFLTFVAENKEDGVQVVYKDETIWATYKQIQNKMHYAVHQHTAAELIVERADADKEHMGLTTWENAPDGKIVKTDVSIAKNYLRQSELEDLGSVVTAVLEFAESRAKRHIPMTMEDWAKRIDAYLSSDERPLLDASSHKMICI